MSDDYFVAGLDLGQAQDYTALGILQIVERWHPWLAAGGEIDYHCRHLQRFPLGTSYPDIVGQVKKLLTSEPLYRRCALVVDATGVGRPVLDLLRVAGLAPVGLSITGGDSVGRDDTGYRVPKRDLVSVLQVLLQSGQLQFAGDLPEVQTLVKELLSFQVKITAAANDTYGAWREGTHDDLVLAVAMAAWFAECAPIVTREVVSLPRVKIGPDW